MRKHFAMLVFVVLILGLCAISLFGQASGTVKGVAKDVQGNPIVDGVVLFANQDNGQKYPLKTNKKGEYFSLGVAPGKYLVTLYKTAEDAKANKELFHVNGFQVQMDENVLDFDLKKEQEKTAQGQGLTPEQIKQMQEAKAKQEKEGSTVKALNEKLAAATTALQGGDYDTAINALNEANQMDPSRDLIWFKLGDAYRLSANKQPDLTEKQKRLDASVAAYQKAVQLKQAVTNDKDPTQRKSLRPITTTWARPMPRPARPTTQLKPMSRQPRPILALRHSTTSMKAPCSPTLVKPTTQSRPSTK